MNFLLQFRKEKERTEMLQIKEDQIFENQFKVSISFYLFSKSISVLFENLVYSISASISISLSVVIFCFILLRVEKKTL